MTNKIDPEKIKPNKELISLRKDWGKEKVSKEGIIYNDRPTGGLYEAVVVRVGDDVLQDVSPGDKIMCSPEGNMRGEIEDVYFMHRDGIVAVVKED
jgi:co-chaperonin GroES (HSP10)